MVEEIHFMVEPTTLNGLTQNISFFQKSHYGKWGLIVSRLLWERILATHLWIID
jgi:hypothetical protein